MYKTDYDDYEDQDIGFQVRGYWITLTVCLTVFLKSD